jgi:4-hydroxybenzoate polyprenyltransferase
MGTMKQGQWRDYCRLMRIDKPIGSLLLMWPTLWALWLASDGTPPLKILIIFVLGVFFMRAAGCVINDYADRKVDGHVKRTAHYRAALSPASRRKCCLAGWCLSRSVWRCY